MINVNKGVDRDNQMIIIEPLETQTGETKMEMTTAQSAEYGLMQEFETKMKNNVVNLNVASVDARDSLASALDDYNEAIDELTEYRDLMETFLEDNNITEI